MKETMYVLVTNPETDSLFLHLDVIKVFREIEYLNGFEYYSYAKFLKTSGLKIKVADCKEVSLEGLYGYAESFKDSIKQVLEAIEDIKENSVCSYVLLQVNSDNNFEPLCVYNNLEAAEEGMHTASKKMSLGTNHEIWKIPTVK
jgi:hypothetical protein